MTRETIQTNKIALLATGDEISNGDILNTNALEIARGLFNHGMHVGMHMVTSDSIAEIEQAILFLLQSHRALIITGGLGPTSDDLTRYALSKAMGKELIFDEPCWQQIVARIKGLGYGTPPESNRRQALFPETATIIPNPNGTAAGCLLKQADQFIFMLPGPPAECLPMFKHVILPELKQANFPQLEYHKNWYLFGVSEGQIAEEMDALAKPYNCVTGYRLFYPYIEFKLHSNDQKDFSALVQQAENVLKPYLINDGQLTASEILRSELKNWEGTLTLCDLATGGSLESVLKTPETCAHLNFTYSLEDKAQITIKGLAEFWQQSESAQTSLHIQFNFPTRQKTIDVNIPFRGARVKHYAVEFICWKILNFKKYGIEKR